MNEFQICYNYLSKIQLFLMLQLYMARFLLIVTKLFFYLIHKVDLNFKFLEFLGSKQSLIENLLKIIINHYKMILYLHTKIKY